MVHVPHNMVQPLSIQLQEECLFSFIGNTGKKLDKGRRVSEGDTQHSVHECVEEYLAYGCQEKPDFHHYANGVHFIFE